MNDTVEAVVDDISHRHDWTVFTGRSDPEFYKHGTTFNATWEDILKNRWAEGAVQLSILCVLGMPVVHFVLHRYVFTPLGKYMIGWTSSKKNDKSQSDQAELDSTLLKFTESAWKCFAFTFLFCVSGYAIYDKTFWYNNAAYWTECTAIPCEYQMDTRMRLSYAMDMAYYTYAVPYSLIFETKRKDFAATMAHHFVTIALILYSFGLGFTKGGVVVMFLHDVCDPWLEIAKMARYSGSDILTNLFFVIFTLVWILMRDIYFPLSVIAGVVWGAWDEMVLKVGYPPYPHYLGFGAMLIFLWLLHLYWTWIILRIAYKSLVSGKTDDDRED